MRPTTERFLAVSAELTGFAADELRATGLVAGHLATLRREVGPEHADRLTALPAGVGHAPQLITDEPLREVARALTHLWYTGSWPGLPEPVRTALGRETAAAAPYTVSADSYAGGLLWQTIGGHAPGTHAPGFGSWTAPPGLPEARR
ncbi:hypothetical protein ACIGXM_27290 [Kitasatospora sp. NPDC052896]|uniref:hypothetical protein n=1 Tax=Kitasatospora sp. NPDC052896 TaxID=3364061 RepID=UPI0037C7E24C